MMTQEALWLCLGSGILGISISAVIVVLIDKLHIVFSPPGVVGPVQFNLALNPMLISVISILFLSLVGITSFTVTHFKLKMKVVDLLSDAGA
jgi:ABC-type antimicrobial peptide transport system permease subunit